MPLTCTSTALGNCYCYWQVRPQPASAPASGCPVLTIFALFTAEAQGRRRELLHTEVLSGCGSRVSSSPFTQLCLWDLFRLRMELIPLLSGVSRPECRPQNSEVSDPGLWCLGKPKVCWAPAAGQVS